MPSTPSISEAFRAHPVDLHDTHLDFETIHELPESHAWPPVSDDLYSIDAVPVINLRDPDVVRLIGNACETWGVFQVTNHGIPLKLFEEVESQARRLFFLPAQQKMKAARSPEGISCYGRARISSFFQKLMWSEGFTIYGSPAEHASKLFPLDYHSFCELMDEYEKEMKKLVNRLICEMLESLGITEEDMYLNNGTAGIQMNSYPPCPDPNRAMGLAAHTDSNLITILHQNKTSGLQVLREGIGWVAVQPTTGALVVNVGDLLYILSNGRYQSALHRALVHRTRHRLSVAYLYGPPSNVQISPLPKLIDLKHPPMYRPVTWSEYLGTKAKHFDKALSSVRLCGSHNGFFEMGDYNRMEVS